MRCTTLTAFLAAAVLVGTGCADSPEAPSAPPDPVLPNLAVVSATTIRTQINELLVDPARTAALFQLRRVQEDIQYKRKTLYLNALALAVIPLHEREKHRIPPEKLEKLFQLLCNVSHLIRPHLPPWLAAIDFCLINPGQLATDAKVQLVTNAFGGTVTTERQTFSLDIEPNSLRDAAGNPVPSVLVVVVPLRRQQPTEGEAHPCPEPWDKSSSGTTTPWYPDDEVDCYEEFYDLSVQPLVQFNPAAELEVCQLDPASEDPNAPSGEGVFGRLELFSKDVANEVRILGQDEDSDAEAEAICDEDNIEHAIGPTGWSRWGMRNALLRVARAGSHALSLFRPTVLYANNLPTHGDIVDELLFGNVIGAIDRGGGGVFIDFETYPDGTPVCEGSCPVTDEYSSRGVVFSFSSHGSGGETASICNSTFHDGPAGTPTNHSVTPDAGSGGCGGWNMGVVRMTFEDTPATVRFRLRGNNACSEFPVAGTAGNESEITETRSNVSTYVDANGNTFRQETVTLTASGVYSVEVDSEVGGCVAFIDNLEIMP
jgi:hypothetical protein